MIKQVLRIVQSIRHHPLTKERVIEGVIRVANWQIKSHTHHEVLVPWINNTKLAVKRGMTGATGNVYFGLHEFEDMAFVLHFLRPGDLFCDVGANVGSYTILGAGVCSAQVFAFEPDPDSANALRRNIEINQISNLVTVYEIGLGAFTAEVKFTVGRDTGNRVIEDRSVQGRTIKISTLDQMTEGCVPAVIKLDVERYEYEVLKGAKNALRSKDLKAIIIEWSKSECIKILNEHGFCRYVYEPIHRSLSQFTRWSGEQNAIFVRDLDFVRRRVETADKFLVLGRSI